MTRRIENFGDGNGTDANQTGAVSGPGTRRTRTNLLSFPSPAAKTAGAKEGAGVSSASASSFVSLGSAVHAVVLRLRGDFPRVRVAGAPREEEQARRPFNQPQGGDERAD